MPSATSADGDQVQDAVAVMLALGELQMTLTAQLQRTYAELGISAEQLVGGLALMDQLAAGLRNLRRYASAQPPDRGEEA